MPDRQQNKYRPFYLKYIEWNPTGNRKMVGYSCVRILDNGQESDWHQVGLMLKPKAQRRLTQLNNAFEQRMRLSELKENGYFDMP